MSKLNDAKSQLFNNIFMKLCIAGVGIVVIVTYHDITLNMAISINFSNSICHFYS